jgi:hypothetical protein
MYDDAEVVVYSFWVQWMEVFRSIRDYIYTLIFFHIYIHKHCD